MFYCYFILKIAYYNDFFQNFMVGVMMIIKKTCVLILLFFMISKTQATTYTYTGPQFDQAFGSYTTMDRVTGSFTTADPLPDNLGNGDISNLVQSYEFNDGVQTLDESNSTIIVFNVSTDSLGNPSTWSITVWAAPVTTMDGGPVQGIGTTYTPGEMGLIQEDGFLDGICFENNGPGGQCSGASFEGTNSGGFFQVAPSAPAGRWLGGRIRVIPTLNILGLSLLIALILLTMSTFNSRRTSENT